MRKQLRPHLITIITIIVFFLALPSLASSALAQQNTVKKQDLYDLENLVLATPKLEGEIPSIIINATSYDKQEVKVNVQKMVQETRTRTITEVGEDGEPETREQKFTVQVPVTEQRNITRMVATGRKDMTIELEEAKFFSLDGKPVANTKEALATVESVFLLRRDVESIPAADEVLQKSLGKRCLVLATNTIPGPDAPAPGVNVQARALAAPVAMRAPARPVAAANFALPAMPLAAAFRPRRRTIADSILMPSNLVLTKLDTSEENPEFICMVEAFRTKEVERAVQKLRTEQRVRTVTVIVNGKPEEKEQTYTVQVPYTENALTKVKVPAGQKPATADWEECRLLRIDGTELSLEEAEEALSSTRPVFLWRGKNTNFEPPSELFQKVVSEDALILLSDAQALFP